MATTPRYPSPTQAQAGSDGPFYNRSQNNTSPPPTDHAQTDADELQLRADLERSLAAPIGSSQHQPHQLDANAQEQPQQQQPSFFSEHEHAELQNRLAQDAIEQHEGSPVDQQGSDAAAKKKDQRQKVSRACDECRRKKIRCDASNENSTEPCSNCRRTSAICTFSRQPMKRGPSKGYIKELAERLHALEDQMQPGQTLQQNPELQFLQAQLAQERQQSPQRPADEHTHNHPAVSPAPAVAGQKRTHDMISQGQPEIQEVGSRPAQGFQDLRQQTPSTPQSPSVPINPSDGRPQPSYGSALQPFFKYGAEAGRRDTAGTAYEAEPRESPTIIDWDEEVIDEYYRLIHQTFPLLPHSKHRLRLRLSECPLSLREAFISVLSCMMRTFPTFQSSLRASQTYASSIKRAAELLASYPFENPASHTNGTNLVYLQTLLLMALECDNHGPATMRGQAGPSRSEWLGRAAGVAGQLEINLIRPRARYVTEGDPDSEERLARRVWWVLFILDRWHASSTADLLKLPENSIVLLPEDQILLGESTYHLARLSFIIGHLAAILTTTKTPETNVMAPTNPASQLLGLTLAGEIDRFRESVESVWGSLNLVHLSYHHSHLLIKRLNPTTEPTEIIGHALKVATVLNQRQTPITPLNHHFAALSAMTLCELVDVPKTRDDAVKGLEQLNLALGEGRGLAGHPESSQGWDEAIRQLVKKKREKIAGGAVASAVGDGGGGAANGGNEGGGRGKGFDPTWVTKYGYLTALGQGMVDGL